MKEDAKKRSIGWQRQRTDIIIALNKLCVVEKWQPKKYIYIKIGSREIDEQKQTREKSKQAKKWLRIKIKNKRAIEEVVAVPIVWRFWFVHRSAHSQVEPMMMMMCVCLFHV